MVQLSNDVDSPQQISLSPTRVALSTVKVKVKSVVVGPVDSFLLTTTCSPSGGSSRVILPSLAILKNWVPSLNHRSTPNSVPVQVKTRGTSGQTGTLVSGLDSSST